MRILRRAAKRAVARLSSTDYQSLNHVEISCSRVLHNFALLQHLHPNDEIIPVLKGNAYGHGLVEMAEILNGADCHFIAVDGYFEAGRIRDITRHRILVMGYVLPQNVGLLDLEHCSFVVQDIAGLRAFGSLKKRVHVHLELNTGMNRLGLQPAELPPYLAELKRHPNLHLEGVMTHLADADNELDDSFTAAQIKAFDAQVAEILAAGFQPLFIHAAQTAGSTKAHSRYTNAMRLGIGLYGINPLGQKDRHYVRLAGLQPVLELRSTIIKVTTLQKGDRVSYNGIFTAPRRMRIGVLPLGYYEGVPRELGNTAHLTVGKHLLPIVGNVCMNHTMVDLGETGLAVGDIVTVISRRPQLPNAITKLAQHNLFSYCLMTGLSNNIKRSIVA